MSLGFSKDDTPVSGGWIEVLEDGALLTLNAKTGWREVEIGRGSSDQTCPVHALEQWPHFAKIGFGPLFVRTSRDGTKALDGRLSDKHVARLIKQAVLDAGIRSALSEKERLALFSGLSLRAGLASSVDVDERFVQKHLGHASAEMTRRYQPCRDRFRVNLTKAAGLLHLPYSNKRPPSTFAPGCHLRAAAPAPAHSLSALTPKAFSKRIAISAESPALPFSKVLRRV